MSLILEALRKSEAERRLGSAPDLLAAMPVLHPPASRSHWSPWIVAACVLITALAIGWWWTHPAQTIHAESVTAPSENVEPHRDTNSDAANRVASNASQSSVTTRESQLPTITLPMTGLPHPIASIAATPAHKLDAALPKQAPSPAPIRASSHSIAPKSADQSSAPAQSNIATITATPASMPTTATPADEPALLSLAELSASERNGLPALKVSMHVYADDPAQRFMIVDGQRVGEGARLADGVTLVRIRHDGAEIDAHGRRLLLPKP